MNEIARRKVETSLERLHRSYMAGFGEHELHDRLINLLDFICLQKGNCITDHKHRRFRSK